MADSAETASYSEPGVDRDARLTLLVLATSVAGASALAAAALALSQSPVGVEAALGILLLVGAATVAEAFPVPVHGVSAGGVSLAASFIVGASLIYDWRAAVLVAGACRGAMEVAQRRPADRLLFNTSAYALAGAATALGTAFLDHRASIAALVLAVLLASLSFYVVNVSLVAVVVSTATRTALRAVLERSYSSTWIPFGLMATVSLLLEVLWTRSPWLAPTLLGPLVAVALYQRSAHTALEAMRLAQTDPLTGLGNHRLYQEHLAGEIELGPDQAAPLTLCVVDVDNFKRLNDVFGHPAGDSALVEIAEALGSCGMAYRVGGDEFAVILPGCGPAGARDLVAAAFERLAQADRPSRAAVRLSGGIASIPAHARTRDELVERADRALYEAKRDGRANPRVFGEQPADRDELSHRSAERRARLEAAGALAELLDASDGFLDSGNERGSHSQRVSALAARIAAALDLDEETVPLVRLAARLHDIGKLAIPHELLRKEHELTDPEVALLREHPEIGARVLESLGAGDIALWILHHHERWDGTGYPYGLREDAIPVPARVIFVADSFDAMTSERPYRAAIDEASALAEIEQLAGRWYDPAVVRALGRVLARPPGERGLELVA